MKVCWPNKRSVTDEYNTSKVDSYLHSVCKLESQSERVYLKKVKGHFVCEN